MNRGRFAFAIFLSVLLLFTLASSRAPAQARKETPAGTAAEARPPRVEIRDTEMRSLASKYAGRTYEIDVALPKDYSRESARYPVLYVLDAEYNFGCVAYIARRLVKNGDIPKVLVVGVAYDTTEDEFEVLRVRDCTPPSDMYGERSGGAENFASFFAKELIPEIDRLYRTIPGDRTIVGHSIGGFFGAYLLFRHPGLFGKYLIVSPSLWYANEVMFRYEGEFASSHRALPAEVYLSTGKDESDRMIRTTERMVRTLKERSYAGLWMKSLIPEGEHHRSIFPSAFTKGLQWLFGLSAHSRSEEDSK
jgi:predicted alpha/beta superfamily hydrolase